MPVPFPEPASTTSDTAELLRTYLAYYRSELDRRIRVLSPEEQRTSRLPTGWTPLELLNHLVHVERRWIVWGFLAEPVDDPWGDEVGDRWVVDDARDADDLLAWLDEIAARTDATLASTPLGTQAEAGGRFGDDPPTLAWIGFHLLQEYARHLGHLDAAVELAGGPTDEVDDDG